MAQTATSNAVGRPMGWSSSENVTSAEVWMGHLAFVSFLFNSVSVDKALYKEMNTQSNQTDLSATFTHVSYMWRVVNSVVIKGLHQRNSFCI